MISENPGENGVPRWLFSIYQAVVRAVIPINSSGEELFTEESPGVVLVEAPRASPVATCDTWRISLIEDESLNDSDKTFVVPADTEYQILWVCVEYASSADAGNRQLVVQTQDYAGDVIGEVRVGVTQAASLTYKYMLAAALADLTAIRDSNWLMTPLPAGFLLQAGDRVRVYDNKGIAPAADDMIVHIQIASRTV